MSVYLFGAARIDRCANESQLEKLLGNSFAYMTVPELKCIPQRIISKLKVRRR